MNELVIDVAGLRMGFRGAAAEVEPLRERFGAFFCAHPPEVWFDTEAGAPIDTVFRAYLAKTLLARGALLVHASAVKIGERAWVFPGPSGAGKSTLARTLDGEPLCDEAVVLRSEQGLVWVEATPYWRARPASAPVAGLVFPKRSQACRYQAIGPGRAAALLASQVGPLAADDLPKVLAAAGGIVRQVSCAEVELASIADIRDWLQPRLQAVS